MVCKMPSQLSCPAENLCPTIVNFVFETPLSELWTSQKVQDQREGMYSKGCTEGCFNHSLYEFTESTGTPFRLPLI